MAIWLLLEFCCQSNEFIVLNPAVLGLDCQMLDYELDSYRNRIAIGTAFANSVKFRGIIPWMYI